MESPRFIADSNVGRLARWLRILGYDVTYDAFIADGELVRQALAEGRIILTRDTGIIQRKAVQDFIFIREDGIDAQIRQVITDRSLRLHPEHFWTRCPMDNSQLRRVAREGVADRVPPYTLRTRSEFAECPLCRRVYWRGSHLDRFLKRLEGIARPDPADPD